MKHSAFESIQDYLPDSNLTTAQQHTMLLGEMFESIQRRIPQLVESYAAKYNLSLLAWLALKSVEQLGEHATLTAIGDAIQASPSTMTGIASRLEQAGYVHRTPSPTDGRASILQYTDRGKNVCDEIIQQFFGQLTQEIEKLDDDELDNILNTFRKILSLIDHLIESAQDTAPTP